MGLAFLFNVDPVYLFEIFLTAWAELIFNKLGKSDITVEKFSQTVQVYAVFQFLMRYAFIETSEKFGRTTPKLTKYASSV